MDLHYHTLTSASSLRELPQLWECVTTIVELAGKTQDCYCYPEANTNTTPSTQQPVEKINAVKGSFTAAPPALATLPSPTTLGAELAIAPDSDLEYGEPVKSRLSLS